MGSDAERFVNAVEAAVGLCCDYWDTADEFWNWKHGPFGVDLFRERLRRMREKWQTLPEDVRLEGLKQACYRRKLWRPEPPNIPLPA